jgi:hypothetical protein
MRGLMAVCRNRRRTRSMLTMFCGGNQAGSDDQWDPNRHRQRIWLADKWGAPLQALYITRNSQGGASVKDATGKVPQGKLLFSHGRRVGARRRREISSPFSGRRWPRGQTVL